MNRPLAELIAEALARSEEDREELIAELENSLGTDDRADDDYPLGPGWAAEIRRRVEAVEAGDSHGIPADEAMRLIMSDEEDEDDDAAG